mmetsp:Transcript_29493/g.34084  ORF Transcript_29493/g.34084 Transcript_29493/m.34084 type:complete len:272 (+) Transcript_29493:87-902(+)
MPPRRNETSQKGGPRRAAIGYNGRRIEKRESAPPSNAPSRRPDGGSRPLSRGNEQRRGGNNNNNAQGGQRGGARFGRRGNNNGNNNTNGNQQQRKLPPLQPQRPVLDEKTSNLLRSLQNRIHALEQGRGGQQNSQREAINRFGRRVDRLVDGKAQKTQLHIPAPRRAGQVTRKPQIRRERSPAMNDRRNNSRADNRRVDRSGNTRHGGVRDRVEWEDGLESRFKRRRRDADGPSSHQQRRGGNQQQQPNRKDSNSSTHNNQFPPLRVHLRN